MGSEPAETLLRRQLRLRLLTGLLLGVTAAWSPVAAGSAQHRPIPSGRLVSGTLSFDGHATAGDFTGTTTTVSGQVVGAPDLTGVRGWVEAPVQTLKTGNGKRDKDLNKSMESDKYPTLRFDLSQVIARGGSSDSVDVVLQGQLRIHGVTREVQLPGRIRFSGTDARVRTDFPLNLKDYRIGGLSKLLGMLKMYEDIEVHADLQFRLDPAAAS
jgi:polyisoprenoid-binding protein YceI